MKMYWCYTRVRHISADSACMVCIFKCIASPTMHVGASEMGEGASEMGEGASEMEQMLQEKIDKITA